MRKKIPYLEFLPILIIGLVLFKLVDRIDELGTLLLYILNILQPVFWALGIAFVLNPMMKFFQRKMKVNRLLAIILCYIIFFGAVVTLITIVIPMIVKNLVDLVNNFEGYRTEVIDYFNKVVVSSSLYQEIGLEEYLNIDAIQTYIVDLPALLNSVVDKLLSVVTGVFGGAFKITVGFIIAVYMLIDKEKFQLGTKKIIYGFFKEKQADNMILFFNDVNKIFSRYIIGKTIDSVIIGIMCFIGLIIMQAPYAALLAIIVGITNMIPYFGPFIGMVPAFILTLFVSPIKALWVLVFIFALQQFDGYYLGPKILGDSVGLSPFWIILGILVGGSLMGVLGMLLAVPIVAVLQMVFTRMVEKRLSKKDIIIE